MKTSYTPWHLSVIAHLLPADPFLLKCSPQNSDLHVADTWRGFRKLRVHLYALKAVKPTPPKTTFTISTLWPAFVTAWPLLLRRNCFSCHAFSSNFTPSFSFQQEQKKSETAERKQRRKKRPTAHFSYGTVFLRIVNFEVSRMRRKKTTFSRLRFSVMEAACRFGTTHLRKSCNNPQGSQGKTERADIKLMAAAPCFYSRAPASVNDRECRWGWVTPKCVTITFWKI